VAEFDRVIMFKGNEVNSAVVHGADQRWDKPVLIRELRRQIRLCEQAISDAKVISLCFGASYHDAVHDMLIVLSDTNSPPIDRSAQWF